MKGDIKSALWTVSNQAESLCPTKKRRESLPEESNKRVGLSSRTLLEVWSQEKRRGNI